MAEAAAREGLKQEEREEDKLPLCPDLCLDSSSTDVLVILNPLDGFLLGLEPVGAVQAVEAMEAVEAVGAVEAIETSAGLDCVNGAFSSDVPMANVKE